MRNLALVLLFSVVVPAWSVTLDKNRPVSKVVTLLKDMLNQLEAEAKEDEEVYEKMACWCTTNDGKKTKEIKKAEDKIEMLDTRIETLTALSARLGTEIEQLAAEIKANEEALATATALREKENAEFIVFEDNTMKSIAAMEEAIGVLKKHNGGDEAEGGFLQMKNNHLIGIAAMVENEMKKHSDLFDGVLTQSEKASMNSFVQGPSDFLGKKNTFGSSYSNQSGEIFGILQQMLETFEKDLAEGRATEAKRKESYGMLKKAKEEEIQAGKEQKALKTEAQADTDVKNENAKEDRTNTKEQLSADSKYLMNLKEKCTLTDGQMQERRDTRSLEMQAVSKALAFLSSDDAQDLTSRTLSGVFLQTESAISSDRRIEAADVISKIASKTSNPRLSTLATSVKLDAFTKVKKAIDDMITELLKEKKDEITLKAYCVKSLDKNRLDREKKSRDKVDHETRIDDLTMQIDDLIKGIKQLQDEITELQVGLKRAGEDRDAENREFQTTVADQRATQELLRQALGVLEDFYGKTKQPALLQQEPAGPPPPAGFKKYKNNEGSGGVMGMIQQIIKDAKAMEEEALKDENSAQEAYASFVKETNDSIKVAVNSMVSKQKQKADAEVSRTEENSDLDETNKVIEQLEKENEDLHTNCDYTMRNFDLRQTARDEEVAALRQAKAILNGADLE